MPIDKALHLGISQRQRATSLEISGATITRERSLPLTCTGISSSSFLPARDRQLAISRFQQAAFRPIFPHFFGNMRSVYAKITTSASIAPPGKGIAGRRRSRIGIEFASAFNNSISAATFVFVIELEIARTRDR
jgi:hypothetical protein